MNGVEQEFGDAVAFVRLDAAQPENQRVQQQYGVSGHPAVVILDDDNAVTARFFGPVTADALRDALSAIVP